MAIERILMVHNAYQQRGGEDTVFEDEAKMLRARGHELRVITRHNDELNTLKPLLAATETLWSHRSASMLNRDIVAFCPDVIHVHNTFPLISPAVYWTAAHCRIPVVQTLHNFRLLCAQAMFIRNYRLCEDCLGRIPWRGIVRRCYHGSFNQSLVLATMLVLHRFLGTYRNKVSRYIALNEFCRQKFIEGGLPANRITVKPNFVVSAKREEYDYRSGFLFVGRLSPEKGIATLVQAAQMASAAKITVIGEGPCHQKLINHSNIDLKGFLERDAVRSAMRRAACLILPSICYETFGLVVMEAFANNLPVITSRLGALSDLVKDGQTGLLFEPGNAKDLAQKLGWVLDHPEALHRMGEAARAEYESKYTPEISYKQLISIYHEVIAEVNQGVR